MDKVPELADRYPEFSMFKELPAWGFFIRHVEEITFDNVTLRCKEEDYRTAIVLDDVHGALFKSLKVEEPGKEKDPVYSYRSTDIEIR